MSRICTVTTGIAALLVITGCASTPTGADGKDREALAAEDETSLYDGTPEVVFATEFPVASAAEAVARADAALKEGKTDLALYMYVRAFDMEPENTYALMRIAQIHDSRGNETLATKSYARVLRHEPEHTAALQGLGLIHLENKRHDEAMALLEKAVAAEPTLWRAHNGIGIIADIDGDHERAIAAFDEAIRVNPREGSLFNNRGYSYYLNGDYPSAARDLTVALSMGVERASVNLGLVLARQADYLKAVHMMSRTEKPEVAYNDVGYIAMRQGHLEVAETYFQRALQISPRYFAEAERNLEELRLLSEAYKSDNGVSSIVSSTTLSQ